jgi:hypothetical protein
MAAAFDLIDAWLQQPSVAVSEPAARHLQTMRDLLLPLSTGGISRRMPIWLRWPSSTGLRFVQQIMISHASSGCAGAIL